MRRFVAISLFLFALSPAPALADHAPWDDLGELPETALEEDLPVEEAPVEEPPEGDAFYDEGDPATISDWPGAQQNPAPTLPVVRGKIIKGRTAMVRTDGKAAIPRGAPKRVRALISSLNQIVGKPYKWGGGHGRLIDSGYDCSGSIGYGLIKIGLQGSPMVSGQYARWAAGGNGRWVTIYAHSKHVYMEVAGLRLDTSPVGDPTGRHGVRWRPAIGRRSGFSVRHPVGL